MIIVSDITTNKFSDSAILLAPLFSKDPLPFPVTSLNRKWHPEWVFLSHLIPPGVMILLIFYLFQGVLTILQYAIFVWKILQSSS